MVNPGASFDVIAISRADGLGDIANLDLTLADENDDVNISVMLSSLSRRSTKSCTSAGPMNLIGGLSKGCEQNAGSNSSFDRIGTIGHFKPPC